MNVVREIERLNEKELQKGGKGPSWHDEYKDSAWIYVGGLPYDLSEGDVICVFSQWGEVGGLWHSFWSCVCGPLSFVDTPSVS
jgi:RNA-binding motif X-linked protein 2